MTERKTLFVNVLLPMPVPGVFTYRVPYELNDVIMVGQRVVVQFGKTKVMSGLVKEITDKVPDCERIKYILGVIDEYPVVNGFQLQLWDWICDYYLCYLGEVMTSALPSAMRLSSESKISISDEFILDSLTLSDYEHLIVEALQSKSVLTISEVSKIVGYKKVMPLIKSMVDRKIIVMEEELEHKFKAKYENYVSLSEVYGSEPALHQLMDDLSKRAYKQLEIVLSFIALGGNVDKDVPMSALLKKANATNNVMKSLIDKNVFYVYEKKISRLKSYDASEKVESINLTDKQQLALDGIREGFKSKKPVLLHGVTSSGKTELYIKLIKDAVDRGKQVLYLLPEIALAEHIINRLKNYFGDMVGVYHSRYSDMERVEIWNQVLDFERCHSKKYQVVIGSRSSIMLPFSNLGLVIVDEEHDPSFKQTDPAPRYNARDVSLILARLHNSNIVLGSATPSFESYYNAVQKRYHLVSLTERYGGLEMPHIIVDDMRVERKRKTINGSFGSLLVDSIKNTLDEKKQVILFQNRRGFSPRVECGVCHWIPQCVNCDVSMTYHKAQNVMRCHYCGYTMSLPSQCPSCNSKELKMYGLGTERVEEEIQSVVPDARISRLDLDTARSKNSYQHILDKFKNHETDILVGTQMVSKGLDFDSVKTVGIIDADSMLSFPDFRAFERSFQMMEQVSGRSGRKGEKGNVIVQSYQPSHPVILKVIEHDYVSFFEEQMPIRRQYAYPPYFRLIMIRLRHQDYERLNVAADYLAKQLRYVFKGNVLGPEYPVVSRVKNQFIKQILIKIDRNSNSSRAKVVLKTAIEDFKALPDYKSVNVSIDVDPV
ncbi:MAG: primosomal protein N' [Candidatus Limimorpha sp.]